MIGFGAAIDDDGLAVPLDLSRLRVDYSKQVAAIADPAFEGMAIHRAHRCKG
jgi:hypothetical protein